MGVQRQFSIAVVTVAVLMAGASASGATISFTDDGQFSASKVSTSGTLVEAVNFVPSDDGDGTTTVNGVSFDDHVTSSGSLDPNPLSNIDFENILSTSRSDPFIYSNTGGDSKDGADGGDESRLYAGGANFDWEYNSGSTNDSATEVTLSGLTSGTPYVVQVVTADEGDSDTSRTYRFFNNTDTSGTPSLAVDNGGSNGYDEVISGTFTADGSTQQFSVDRNHGNRGFVIGAMQIRATVIPEPASLALLAPAGLLALRRRR